MWQTLGLHSIDTRRNGRESHYYQPIMIGVFLFLDSFGSIFLRITNSWNFAVYSAKVIVFYEFLSSTVHCMYFRPLSSTNRLLFPEKKNMNHEISANITRYTEQYTTVIKPSDGSRVIVINHRIIKNETGKCCKNSIFAWKPKIGTKSPLTSERKFFHDVVFQRLKSRE